MTSSLLGLAPGGGYLAIHITADAGGLLHHLFTITLPHPNPLPKGEGPGMRGGCLFLWPSSGRLAPHGGFPAPGAIRRRALWSADFPRPRQRRAAIAQPT